MQKKNQNDENQSNKQQIQYGDIYHILHTGAQVSQQIVEGMRYMVFQFESQIEAKQRIVMLAFHTYKMQAHTFIKFFSLQMLINQQRKAFQVYQYELNISRYWGVIFEMNQKNQNNFNLIGNKEIKKTQQKEDKNQIYEKQKIQNLKSCFVTHYKNLKFIDTYYKGENINNDNLHLQQYKITLYTVQQQESNGQIFLNKKIRNKKEDFPSRYLGPQPEKYFDVFLCLFSNSLYLFQKSLNDSKKQQYLKMRENMIKQTDEQLDDYNTNFITQQPNYTESNKKEQNFQDCSDLIQKKDQNQIGKKSRLMIRDLKYVNKIQDEIQVQNETNFNENKQQFKKKVSNLSQGQSQQSEINHILSQQYYDIKQSQKILNKIENEYISKQKQNNFLIEKQKRIENVKNEKKKALIEIKVQQQENLNEKQKKVTLVQQGLKQSQGYKSVFRFEEAFSQNASFISKLEFKNRGIRSCTNNEQKKMKLYKNQQEEKDKSIQSQQNTVNGFVDFLQKTRSPPKYLEMLLKKNRPFSTRNRKCVSNHQNNNQAKNLINNKNNQSEKFPQAFQNQNKLQQIQKYNSNIIDNKKKQEFQKMQSEFIDNSTSYLLQQQNYRSGYLNDSDDNSQQSQKQTFNKKKQTLIKDVQQNIKQESESEIQSDLLIKIKDISKTSNFNQKQFINNNYRNAQFKSPQISSKNANDRLKKITFQRENNVKQKLDLNNGNNNSSKFGQNSQDLTDLQISINDTKYQNQQNEFSNIKNQKSLEYGENLSNEYQQFSNQQQFTRDIMSKDQYNDSQQFQDKNKFQKKLQQKQNSNDNQNSNNSQKVEQNLESKNENVHINTINETQEEISRTGNQSILEDKNIININNTNEHENFQRDSIIQNYEKESERKSQNQLINNNNNLTRKSNSNLDKSKSRVDSKSIYNSNIYCKEQMVKSGLYSNYIPSIYNSSNQNFNESKSNLKKQMQVQQAQQQTKENIQMNTNNDRPKILQKQRILTNQSKFSINNQMSENFVNVSSNQENQYSEDQQDYYHHGQKLKYLNENQRENFEGFQLVNSLTSSNLESLRKLKKKRAISQQKSMVLGKKNEQYFKDIEGQINMEKDKEIWKQNMLNFYNIKNQKSQDNIQGINKAVVQRQQIQINLQEKLKKITNQKYVIKEKNIANDLERLRKSKSIFS